MALVQIPHKCLCRISYLPFLVLCCLCLLLCFYKREDLKHFFNTPKLLDDVLDGPRRPNLGRSIFFLDISHLESYTGSILNLTKTRPQSFNFINLTARAACAVESAALHNPNSDIFVLFTGLTYWNNETENPVTNAILSYTNVFLRNLDLRSYVAGTPSEEWFQTRKLFKSNYLTNHVSDFLRSVTLWRFGGTYLDMDVVVLKSLEELPPNYVGAESLLALANGVMNFGYDAIGREVAEYYLNDFQSNFKGHLWSHNGPGVITRTLKHFCKTDRIANMFDGERCLGFRVYKPYFFYAVYWTKWWEFFDEKKTESTLKRIEKSYVAHVWNKLSKARKIHIGTYNAYGELAIKHCPRVFATVRNYF